MKYTLEFKLECINKFKNGIYVDKPLNCKGSNRNFMSIVREWTKIYDLHGADGLTHTYFNHQWTKDERFNLVAQVLAGKPICQVAFENNINKGQLYHWVRRYREKGVDGLELYIGRKPKAPTMPKKKTKLTKSEKEELKLLRERNEYLEAENAYLKKLDALVTQREAAHPKAKKQKLLKK